MIVSKYLNIPFLSKKETKPSLSSPSNQPATNDLNLKVQFEEKDDWIDILLNDEQDTLRRLVQIHLQRLESNRECNGGTGVSGRASKIFEELRRKEKIAKESKRLFKR